MTTRTATLTISNTSSFRIVTEPADASAPEGEIAKTTVVAEGEGLTYTWYFKNAGQSQFSKSSARAARIRLSSLRQ